MSRDRGRWLKLYESIADQKATYTAQEFAAFITILVRASQQPVRGTYRTMALLRASVGWRYARSISRLIQLGDLVQHESGAISVAHWSEYQDEPATGAERTRAWRDRQHRDNGVTHGTSRSVTDVAERYAEIRDDSVTPSDAGEESRYRREVEPSRHAPSPRGVAMGWRPRQLPISSEPAMDPAEIPPAKHVARGPDGKWIVAPDAETPERRRSEHRSGEEGS